MTIPDFSDAKLGALAFEPLDAPGGRLLAGQPSNGSTGSTVWETPEGIAVAPVYTAADLVGVGVDLFPGLAPYVRGPYPAMYVTQPWTVRQYAGFSTAAESNAFYRRNLAAGQKGLSVAFDLPTHRGYDSDNPRVVGDVGMAGVAIDSILDMQELFDGIPLGEISVSMTMNGAVLPDPGVVCGRGRGAGRGGRAADRHDPERHPQGVHGPQHLHLPAGSVDADRVGHLPLHRGAECRGSIRSRSPGITSRRPGRRRIWSWRTRWRTGWSIVRAGLAAGLAVDEFAPRLSFFWGIGMNFFMEVAKLRAARLLWTQAAGAVRPDEPEIERCCARIARRRAGR